MLLWYLKCDACVLQSSPTVCRTMVAVHVYSNLLPLCAALWWLCMCTPIFSHCVPHYGGCVCVLQSSPTVCRTMVAVHVYSNLLPLCAALWWLCMCTPIFSHCVPHYGGCACVLQSSPTVCRTMVAVLQCTGLWSVQIATLCCENVAHSPDCDTFGKNHCNTVKLLFLASYLI